MVRRKLDDLGLDYETIEVPTPQHERTEVFNLSGQYTVPVLVDGEIILSDEDDRIISPSIFVIVFLSYLT